MEQVEKGLISGKEALIALVNGEEVQCRNNITGIDWANAKYLPVESFFNPTTMWSFRLKQKTILLNGIEIPAPFEPKNGEEFYNIQPCNESGWMGDKLGYQEEVCDKWVQFGAWRTEDEIKQVVAALKKVFKG